MLVAAAAAAHAPSLWASFIWDDREFLWENPLTLSDNGIVEFWTTTDKWPDCADEVPYDFRAECAKVRGIPKDAFGF